LNGRPPAFSTHAMPHRLISLITSSDPAVRNQSLDTFAAAA